MQMEDDEFGQNQSPGGNGTQNNDDEEVIELTESQIVDEFDKILQSDPGVNDLLASCSDDLPAEDKISIIQAYKAGGI